jgi:hypothetical protein
VAGPQRPGHVPASVAGARLALDPERHERIASLFAEPPAPPKDNHIQQGRTT